MSRKYKEKNLLIATKITKRAVFIDAFIY
ncbi:hypothetical protein BSG1_20014 [Bacillus sp. SG-1]|nr:hypothetical protein BSG1_20014 [Bacillus sp. SG-1]